MTHDSNSVDNISRVLLKRVLYTANILLMVGVFVFAFIYGRSLLERASFAGLNEQWWMLIIAAALFAAYYITSSLHWLKVSRIVDQETPSSQALAYFASQPYKYLPTSIFSFSFRAKYAKDLGLSLKKSSYTQLIENFNILGSGIFVTLAFLGFYVSFFLGTLCVITLLSIVYFVRRTKFILKIPMVKSRPRIHVYRLTDSFLIMTAAWLFGGVSFWMVSSALGLAVSPWLAISANAAGFVISILAIFAPGGIGVRELTLALFTIQGSAIVLWRILTFTFDMVFGVVSIALINIKYKK